MYICVDSEYMEPSTVTCRSAVRYGVGDGFWGL